MGLFAYLNYDTPTDNKNIAQNLINALKILALRGYDSVGVGFPNPSDPSKLSVYKNAGSVEKLAAQLNAAQIPEKDFRNNVAMAHTRWATHGVVSDQNAHPMPSDSNNEFLVCLNGMIQNFAELKEELTSKGIKFETETDTEVVAKLIKHTWEQNKTIPFGGLVRNVVKQLEGAFALAVMSTHYPNEFVTTTYGSPLFLGVNMYDKSPPPEKKRGNIGRTESKSTLFELARSPSSTECNRSEYFISSSEAALSSYTPTCIQLQDGDLLHFRNGRYQYYNTKEDKVVSRDKRPQMKTGGTEVSKQMDKGKYAHYMLKEIYEQADSIVNVLRGRVDFEKNTIKLGGIEPHAEEIRFARRLVFIASASSYNAAIACREIIEELTSLAITIEFSTDFMDRMPQIERNDVCIFVSQSGETNEVIKALEYCKKAHALCIGITNTVGSPLAKMSDCGIYLNAGIEIGVASTKVYTSEIVALILLALKLGENTINSQARRVEIIQGLKELPDQIRKVLTKEAQIANVAAKIKDSSSVLVMGRGWNYATCAEGALKLKEVSSMHSEGVLSGELKHGPLALVDETMPIVFVATKDNNYDQVINSFSQVTARSGAPIILCTEGDDRVPAKFDRIEIPPMIDCLQVVVNIIPLQLLSYHVALLRGIDVDFSKNLVKVVNV